MTFPNPTKECADVAAAAAAGASFCSITSLKTAHYSDCVRMKKGTVIMIFVHEQKAELTHTQMQP
jgi:hypothetical protein